MATLREWLTNAGFDWDTGTIIYQEIGDDENYPGWASELKCGSKIPNTAPILDHKFSCGFGGPMCPRILAKDRKAVYFPSKYDGSTELVKVVTDVRHYLKEGNDTPYPGGG